MIRIFHIAVLVLASLTGWSQQGMLLAVPADGEAFLLDTYTGASAAYSVHKMSSTATNCVTIQRASDNDTLVVGFSGDDFDSASALAFVSGADNGYVRTWWDQSGNGNHAVQSDTSLMPMIIRGGALITINSKAAVDFDGVNDYLLDDGAADDISTDYTKFVIHYGVQIVDDYFASMGSTSSNQPINAFRHGSITSSGVFERSPTGTFEFYNVLFSTNVQELFSKKVGSSDHELFRNNVSVDTDVTDIGSITVDRLSLGALFRSTPSNYAEATLQLMIMYPSDKSADISNINTAINNYYSIY